MMFVHALLHWTCVDGRLHLLLDAKQRRLELHLRCRTGTHDTFVHRLLIAWQIRSGVRVLFGAQQRSFHLHLRCHRHTPMPVHRLLIDSRVNF